MNFHRITRIQVIFLVLVFLFSFHNLQNHFFQAQEHRTWQLRIKVIQGNDIIFPYFILNRHWTGIVLEDSVFYTFELEIFLKLIVSGIGE